MYHWIWGITTYMKEKYPMIALCFKFQHKAIIGCFIVSDDFLMSKTQQSIIGQCY